MQIIWQTTTKGIYIRKSSVADSKTGKRTPVDYRLIGSLHHIFTTTDPPSAFELQFRNRTFWLEVQNSDLERYTIHKAKLTRGKGKQISRELRDIIFQSWSYLPLLPELKRLDPADPNAFADVDTSVLGQLAHDRDLTRLGDDDLRRVDMLIVLVMAHALINQKHRQQIETEDGRFILIANAEDLNAVLGVFSACVASERKPHGQAHQKAFLSIIPKLVLGAMSTQEMAIALDKAQRTVQGYINSWKHQGLVAEERGRYSVGPAIRNVLADPAVITADSVKAAAEKVYGLAAGFQPQSLPDGGHEACKCSLHVNR